MGMGILFLIWFLLVSSQDIILFMVSVGASSGQTSRSICVSSAHSERVEQELSNRRCGPATTCQLIWFIIDGFFIARQRRLL